MRVPGIVGYAFCMPDGQWGYGFPNCGMRLVLTNLSCREVEPHLEKLVDGMFERVFSGAGSSGAVKIGKDDF